ncbi:hypothetical protein K456DRAFT_1667156 [Colletotrichum gloeosporioides 23]|nr:hypothetical protein K456DRAFT_1667156 [Colletotrichum gloeosporioides 23]
MEEKLSLCENHTQVCHPMAREHFIPDRLIDVSNDALKIIPKREIWQGPETFDRRYAALSYCWGKKEDALAQAKLTTANMAQRLQNFDFSELTISIQESIMVTRALGLRYLWVDALCIIQGAGSDWAIQCAIMDKIYRIAYVTVCALGSASCRQGFLQKRAKMTLPFQSRLHPSITGSFAVDQPVIRETGHCLDPWSMDYDVAESNWDDRGWTFQENVLSTRMLLFGKRSVHFSCSEFHVSKQCRHWAGSETFQFPSAKHMEYDRVELYDRWSSRLVTSYTDRTKTLTVGTDVLPAFAGLWKGDLHRALVWMRVEAADDRVWLDGLLSPRTYMGPSWSWARLAHMCDGVAFPMYQVGEYAMFSHTRCQPEYDLHHFEATPSGPNQFGAVSNGVLEITAKSLSLKSSMSTTQEQAAWCDESIFRLQCDGTTTIDIQLDFECLRNDIVMVPLGVEASRLRLILIGSTIEEPKANEFCEDDAESDEWIECRIDHSEQSGVHNPIEGKQPLRPIAKKDRTAYGLVVYPTLVSGEFYRVGIFFSTPQSGAGLDAFDLSHTERISIV